MNTENVPVLKLSNVSRSFGNVKAVNAISLEIKRGEVVGLVGENGAGKSTLLKILAGMMRPDEGQMEINGTVANFRGPNDAFKAGVGVVHQEQSLFTNLTVAENIEQRSAPHVGMSRLGLQDWPRLNREATAVLEKIGAKLSPKARVGDLSFVDRQMVEIARAVCVDPGTSGTPLIILDEPTAVLEKAETDVLEREIRNLKELGSVIFVSHRLDEILRICDRVVVMRSGKLVSDKSTEGLTKEDLFNAMVDEESHPAPRARTRPSLQVKPAIEVHELTRKGFFRNVSFSVYPGQIVALVGANGSGCVELMRAIFGAEIFDSGSIKVAGNPVARWSIRRAVGAGLAYVPAERKVEGMIGGFSAARNIALVHPGEAVTGPFFRPRRLAQMAQSWFDRLDVRPKSISRPLAQFSGGNQQKVVLAKWLNSSDLKVLMLDHPLRGLDVGAAQAVNSQIKRAAEKGTSVILIPDTIEEAIEMADEIIVMRDGEMSARHDLSITGDLPIHDIVAEMV
jgi:ribose transport system ATP-binding protein